MLRNLLIGAAVTVATLFSVALEAKADVYGYGDNYYEICNYTDSSYVTYKTDVTSGTLDLENGECDTIWTYDNYIVVSYDDSWAPGDQWNTVHLYYSEDLEFYTQDYDSYGEVIGHYVW